MKALSTICLIAMASAASAQTTYQLTNSGTTFSPNLITMQAGDSIHVVLPAPHTCTEVSQATWDANGNTPNGGFNYPSGTETFSLDVPGTYYFVCIPHAAMGMKGQIVVNASTTAVQEVAAADGLQLYPNPANTKVTVSGIAVGQVLNVVDVNGRTVLEATSSSNGVLDVSMLAPGTYTIMATNGQGKPSLQGRLLIAR